MKIFCNELDDKLIAYNSETEFLIQVGYLTKGSYETKFRIVGDLAKAVTYYNGINIGLGYKKRLYVPSFNKPILAKAKS